MLDISWSEILLIAVVAIVVMGPQDIPKVMMALGRIMRRFQYIKYALSQQFEDVMKETDLDDLRKINFEKSKDFPEFDEISGDLEDYNEGMTHKASSDSVKEHKDD